MNASGAMKIAACALVLVTATALADQRAPEPTAFEKFVANPDVIVEFEQWVGSIDSTDAKLSVTALVAHHSADPARRMRGLRLTMEDNSGTDSVYVDEAGFAALKQDLASVEQMRTTLRNESDAPYRVAEPRAAGCPSAGLASSARAIAPARTGRACCWPCSAATDSVSGPRTRGTRGADREGRGNPGVALTGAIMTGLIGWSKASDNAATIGFRWPGPACVRRGAFSAAR